jgi:hypothetical protein
LWLHDLLVLILAGWLDVGLGCGDRRHGLGDTVPSLGISLTLPGKSPELVYVMP